MNVAKDTRFAIVNGVVSVAAVTFLGWLLLVNEGRRGGDDSLAFVPAMNAGLNALAASLLLLARRAIARNDVGAHRRFVFGALTCSAIFLVGYVTYHAAHGDTPFVGGGIAKALYLAMLATHVIGSIAVLPMIFTAVYLASQERFEAHKRVTRVTYPLWLYVSITGVLIYFALSGSRG